MEKSKYSSIAVGLFCTLAGILLIWLLFEYALGIILPFAIALCVGIPIYRLSLKIHKKTGIPRRLCAFILVLLFLALLGLLIFIAFNRLLLEIEGLVVYLEKDSAKIGESVGLIFDYVENISSRLPFIDAIEKIEGFEDFRETVDASVSEIFSDFLSTVSAAIPAFVIRLIRQTPKALITVFVCVLSCFYFAIDYGRIKDTILSKLGDRSRGRVEHWLGMLSDALGRYVRAYLLIMLLTFTEVFIGLMILGKRYAFLLAILIALVDILPVFGAGTVLLPWGIISILMKDFKTGTGILILYGVITIVRQIVEPKIVGESLGVHPLLTLFAMFAGLTLFGIPGMLLGPLLLYFIHKPSSLQ